MTINTGSKSANPEYMDFFEEIPEPTATPSEPAPQEPAPAPTTEPTPAPQATEPVVEGQQPPAPAEPAKPVEPAVPAPTEQPRESAMVRRAREAREKAQGLLGLANKLDPQGVQQPAPQPPAPPAPTAVPSPTPNLEPDYFDETGAIDPAKHADWSRRVAASEAQRLIDARDQTAQANETKRQIGEAVTQYANEVDSDAKYLESQVPELNPKSPEYNEKLDNFIEREYKKATMDSKGSLVRIDLPLKDFAQGIVDIVREARTQGAASVPNSQVGVEGALIPDAQTTTTGEATEAEIAAMSADEYEQYLVNKKGVKTVQR